MSNSYTIIIDTDEYSGNFEREMCAYCTGQVGECEVGEEEQAVFDETGMGLGIYVSVYSQSEKRTRRYCYLHQCNQGT